MNKTIIVLCGLLTIVGAAYGGAIWQEAWMLKHGFRAAVVECVGIARYARPIEFNFTDTHTCLNKYYAWGDPEREAIMDIWYIMGRKYFLEKCFIEFDERCKGSEPITIVPQGYRK